MTGYLIAYDLVGARPQSDYERLIAAIKAYFDWGHIQDSVWFVKSERLSTEVFDELWPLMGEYDRLLVLPIRDGVTCINEMSNHDWLENFLG